MRKVVPAVEQRMSAVGIEQVEGTERVDAILLIHPAALALEYVVQQTANALRMKGHSRFPVRPPPVEGDIERAEYAILIVEDDELGVHVGIDLDQVMMWRTENAHQFDAGALQSRIVFAIGEGHLPPVDDALHPDSVVTGMHQMSSEVMVVNAVHAHLDGAKALGMRLLAANHLVDVIVDEALGMIGMILLPLGKLGNQTQGIEMMVVPVDIALQLPGVAFVGVITVVRGPFGSDSSVLRVLVAQLGPIHEDVLELRGHGVLVTVHDESELDTIDGPETA